MATARRFRPHTSSSWLLVVAAALGVTLQLGSNVSSGRTFAQGLGNTLGFDNKKFETGTPLDRVLMNYPEPETLMVAEKFTGVKDVWNTPYTQWLTKDEFRTRLKVKFTTPFNMPTDEAFDIVFDSFNLANPEGVDSPEKLRNAIRSWRGSDGKVDGDAVKRSVIAGKFYIFMGVVLHYSLTVLCPLILAYFVGSTYVAPLVMPSIQQKWLAVEEFTRFYDLV